MGDLQATIEFLVELYKFYNVDLFIRGYYQFRLTFKAPKTSHAIQVEVCEGHGERGAFTLFPAFVTNDDQTAVSRTFNIYYKDEEVLLKDVFLFRVHLLIDSAKAADCIDKAALEMTVDVHFTDQIVRESNYHTLPLVTSRTLTFHFSCFNGLHHQVPLLFDYYYFSVLDMIVHANVVALSLPNWSILKQIKTGWFSKSTTTPRSSTPLFYTTLFGNRALGVQSYSDATLRSICIQFYSDVSLRYAVTNTNSISREHFEKASAVHRNLCAILAMAHSQLLSYFDEMMHYLDEKQRIKLAEKLDPADLVEGLCKKLETLQSCEEVFDEMCSDMSVLNNELALLWLQFQESFTLNDQIRPVLREQHHHERVLHLSEAFFVHELPWKSLLNVTDSSFQKHLSMGQCVKSSRYLSMIPPVTIECAEVDGDSSSTPIFFEDRYVNEKGKSLENLLAVQMHGGIEDDVLEHKPLALGILNKAFNDNSPQVTDSAGSSDIDVDTKDVWVDIKASNENGVAGATHAEQDAKGSECKVTEKTEEDDKGEEGTDSVLDGHDKVDMNASTANAREMNSDNLGSTEATNGNGIKTLLEYSMENLLNNMETPQGVNIDLKGTCTAEGNQEHCRTMESSNDGEIRDVSDITVIDTAAEEQTKNSNTEAVTGTEPSKSDTQSVDVIDPAITSLSEDSEPNIREGLSEICKGSNDIDASAACNKDCLKESFDATQTTCTQDGVLKPKISNSSTPVSNSESTCEHSQAIHNDSSLGAANCMEVIISEQVEQSNSKTSSEKVSSNRVVVQCSVEETANKKASSARYVGSSDTTTENGSNVTALDSKEMHKSGITVGNRLSGQSEHVAGGNDSSQVEEQDETCGKDDANKLCENAQDETILSTRSREGDKIKVITSEPGCNDVNNSSSKQPFEISSSTDVTETSNALSGKSSKVRNTAQVNPANRVSNSIFYQEINSQNSCTEQDLQNRQISNMQLDTLKLSSNSSSDVISCFCGGKLVKTSSPYRPVNENDASNIILQKAKKEVISRMNYCGTLYSDLSTEFLVKPYFINPKPDLSQEPVHFVVCVHGLDGNSGDLRLLRCFLEMALPSTKFEFLMSEVNQDNTFVTFEKQTDQLVSEILHHMEAYRISPSRISFIGHSLGNIIIRSALNHPQMEPYVELFHTYLSLSGPHLGMVHHTSSLVSTGMWLLQKWKKSDSLLQLSLNDSTDMRDTFIYKLSKTKGLEYFTNVLLVSSVQDHYAPFHSSRIELPKSLRSNSQEYIVYCEMMENLLTPLLSQPNRSLVRYSVYHCLPSSTNTFIGRAAHIAMLDSELFIEKFICTSAAKYFQ